MRWTIDPGTLDRSALAGPLVGAALGLVLSLVTGRRRLPLLVTGAGLGALAGGLLTARSSRAPTREVGPPPEGSRALPPGRKLYHDLPPPGDGAGTGHDDLRRNRETDWEDDLVDELARIDIREGLVNLDRPPMEARIGDQPPPPGSVRGAPVGDLEPERLAHRDRRGAVRMEAHHRIDAPQPPDAHVGDIGEPGEPQRAAYEIGVELAGASRNRRLNRLEVEDLGRERWTESRFASVPFEQVLAALHRGYAVASGA